MTYVYPVVSRRAGGVSVGVNLNPNNACNWRCVYCQVPGLVRGGGPDIDLELLGAELERMLRSIVHGEFLERHVPEGARRLNDVAFSGNGEPTSSPQFGPAIERTIQALGAVGSPEPIKLVLITNGSLVHRPEVQAALACLAEHHGEVWFKADSATDAGMRALNDTGVGFARTDGNLRLAAELCPTWIQTCALARDGAPPTEAERAAYLAWIDALVADGVPLRGVLLYGLARPSHQPEAAELAALPREWMEEWAERIRARGVEVRLSL